MKKIIVTLIIIAITLSCDSGSFSNRNPFLPNYPVDIQINLNLPQYSSLQFAANNFIVYDQGVLGVVIFNTGSGYVAFDIACPNQNVSECPQGIVIQNSTSINGTCPCDDAVYSLFNGISPGKQYPLKQYRTQLSGNYLTVTN